MKPLILPVILAALLGSIYVLPQRGSVAEASVTMKLPAQLDGWQGVKRAPTLEEIQTLATDTEFEKADYFRTKRSLTSILGEKQDIIHASIVLSGVDINNSIHRPERCLPSQGHFGIIGTNDVIEIRDGRKINVRRLVTKQKVRLNDSEELVLDSLTYYFFVGHEQITHDHLERTFMDMRDRLFRGYDQRWAYVTLSMRFGDVPQLGLETTQEEAEIYLKGFFRDLIGEIVDTASLPE
jgi:hypothetical protein